MPGDARRHEIFPPECAVMKLFLAIAATVLLCAACAGGGAARDEGSGSLTMYGTIDQGVTFGK
jgi:hypothetical protein